MKHEKNGLEQFRICLFLMFIGVIFSFGINVTSAANSSSVYVSTHGNDSYDGLSSTWTGGINGPKATIKNATGTVKSDGTVHIASGIYKESNIQIHRNMEIIGENKDNTVINGQKSGRTILTIASGIKVNITGLTFTNNTVSGSGGAVYNTGTLTMTNCILNNNTANGGGGAIRNYGSILIDNSTFVTTLQLMVEQFPIMVMS